MATDGSPFYRTDEDRQRFLGLVAQSPEPSGTQVHAFVLMDSHYPPAVRCRRADLSETLRRQQTAYAIQFNRRHRRRGQVI